jgi:hypothetical protein
MSRADEVDLDLLADFAAGVLDPSDTAQVAHLVATDDRWAAALTAVRAADDLVRAELSDLARSSFEPMPADVALRLDEAFRDAGGSSPIGSLAAARSRRTRRSRYLMGFAAAAATLVLVLFGVTVTRGLVGTEGTTSAQHAPAGGRDANSGESGGGVPDIAPTPSAVAQPPNLTTGEQLTLVATNVNYTLDALRELSLSPQEPDDASVSSSREAIVVVPSPVRRAAPAALARLTDPAALRACLLAIRTAHPGTAVLVDFANFEGQPALIVSLRGKTPTTVAVGPECGVGGASAELASA